MNASARTHAAPVHAGDRLGPTASGSSPAANRPEVAWERGRDQTEFIYSVRGEGAPYVSDERRMGEGRQATLWSIRDGDETSSPIARPVGEGRRVHDQGVGQPKLPAAGAPSEFGAPTRKLEGLLPARSDGVEYRSETARAGDMGILGGAAECDALSIRPQEGKGRLAEHLRPADLARLLNSTPLGHVISARQIHRQRERADHRFVIERRIDLFAYVAWLACERHAPPSRLDLPGRHRAICTRDLLNLLNAQKRRCALSGRVLEPANAAMDHILPVSRGGRHSIENVQLLEKALNRAKGTMTNEEFIGMCRAVVAWTDGRQEGAT